MSPVLPAALYGVAWSWALVAAGVVVADAAGLAALLAVC